MQINNLSFPYILTADIGGSHITAGICNMDTHTILQQSITRMEVISNGAANDILAAWGSALKRVLTNASIPVSGLSIAMPGPFDYKNGISYIKGLNKYEALYGMDIRRYLAELLQFDPQLVRFRNDAESTIAGEVLAGAGKGYKKVLGVTLGTGFGSAYSQNMITKDINLGSNTYKQSIADDYLSTRWFLKRYHELSGVLLTGGVRELSDLAVENEVAKRIFREFAFTITDFLSGPLAELAPEILIICGNIAKASEFFIPYLGKGLSTTFIKLGELGEYAPLIGAAGVFEQ